MTEIPCLVDSLKDRLMKITLMLVSFEENRLVDRRSKLKTRKLHSYIETEFVFSANKERMKDKIRFRSHRVDTPHIKQKSIDSIGDQELLDIRKFAYFH